MGCKLHRAMISLLYALKGAWSGSRYPLKGQKVKDTKVPKSFFGGNFAVYMVGPIYFN